MVEVVLCGLGDPLHVRGGAMFPFESPPRAGPLSNPLSNVSSATQTSSVLNTMMLGTNTTVSAVPIQPPLAGRGAMHVNHTLSAMALHQQPGAAQDSTRSIAGPQPLPLAGGLLRPDCDEAAPAAAAAAAAAAATAPVAVATQPGLLAAAAPVVTGAVLRMMPVHPQPSVASTTAITVHASHPRNVLVSQWGPNRHTAPSDSHPAPLTGLSIHGAGSNIRPHALPQMFPATHGTHTTQHLQYTPPVAPAAAPHTQHLPQQQQQQRVTHTQTQQLPVRAPTPAHGAIAHPVRAEAAAAIPVVVNAMHAQHAHAAAPPPPAVPGVHPPRPIPHITPPVQHDAARRNPRAAHAHGPHQRHSQGYVAGQPWDTMRGQVGEKINDAVVIMKSKLLADAPQAQLRICSLLGSGGFGTVYLGTLQA